jgi:murein DD-endopeptidase MepM/ murein hydrolase activator NlpD
VSFDGIGDLLARAHSLTGEANKPSADTSERERLASLASEFESMLLLQMLKEMRKAGSWDDDGDADTLGADTLFETLDVELARHLSAAQTLGLKRELVQAFDRKYGTGASGEEGLPARARINDIRAGYGISSVASGFSPQPESGTVPSTTGAFAPIDPSSAPVSEHLDEDGMDELTRPAGKVTSSFGWRADPFNGASKFHGGIDVRAAYGQDVTSAGAGRVVSSGDERGYGTTVVVEHADGVRTRYAHLSAALVEKGDAVAAGQVLGRAGQSGRATGPHLHFEVIANGVRVDPATIGSLGRIEEGRSDARDATSPLKPEGVVADLAVRRTTPVPGAD